MALERFTVLAIHSGRKDLAPLKSVLEAGLPGAGLLTAPDGQGGIGLARVRDPDVILLDFELPEREAIEVCRRLKADEWLRAIPVLFLMGPSVDQDSRIGALEAGGEGFLSAPCEQWELVAQIRAMAKVKIAHRWGLFGERERESHQAGHGVPSERESASRGEARQANGAVDRDLLILNQAAIGLTAGKAGKTFYAHIARRLKDLTRGSSATLGVYDPADRCVYVKHAELDHSLITDLVFALGGRRLTEVGFPISDEVYRKLETKPIDYRFSLSEATFGVVPNLAGKLAQKLQGIDRFLGIAYFLEGELYGTSLVALRAEVPDPRPELVHSFAHMVAVALRRIRAEEALRESEERYRTILDQAADAVIMHDRSGRILEVNAKACLNLGYSREEMLSKSIGEIDAGASPAKNGKLWDRILAGEYHRFESRQIRKDGSPMPVEVTLGPVRLPHGPVILGIARDITEKKALEEQLRQSQKMEAVGRLAGGLAHDLNNILTAVTGYAELLTQSFAVEDPRREDAGEIKRAGDRAAELVRQLLAFSRKQVLQPVVLDLNRAVSDLDRMLRRLIGEDISLKTMLAPEIGRVKADPAQIEQVILNLAVNARDAMPRGGKLTIETANVELSERYAREHVAVVPGAYVMLAVSDTGVGMDEAIRRQVFDPFFTTKEKGKGTGLGLSTVYGIVKQSGGNIWVYSEPGAGSSFKVYLPRVDEAEEVVKREEAAGFLGGGETILVVEDEARVLGVTRKMLEGYGYRVVTAGGAPEAEAKSRDHVGEIDLLLTDVVMPGTSGPELARRILADRPGTKVLYMSGYTDNAIVHHGVLERGMNFIQKPFTPMGLARKVREVLGEAKSG